MKLKNVFQAVFLRKLLCLSTLMLAPTIPRESPAQIEGIYQVAIKKQEEKKQSRWSLADWLIQKQRIRAMDLWLAKNSHSSPFEFFLEGRSTNYGRSTGVDDPTKVNHNSYGGTFAAYAGLAGLRGSYEGGAEDRSNWTGSFNLRVFGRALQDTHINLGYGLRGLSTKTTSGEETFQNQFGSVSLNLYLTKFFGLEGSYNRMLPENSNLYRTLEGETSKAGAFIDFGPMRIFGEWNHEYLRFHNTDGSETSEQRQGFGGGLRFYF